MAEVTINKMKPGVVYYGVQGSCSKLFKVSKIFDTRDEALKYIEELVEKYNPLYAKSMSMFKGNVNTVRSFISIHKAMVESNE